MNHLSATLGIFGPETFLNKSTYTGMFTIENSQLKVIISPKGAELQSIFNKEHQLEYMWSGDPAFWSKRSPVLFPIVGTLKDNSFHFNEKTYHLDRHGFARDMSFKAIAQTLTSVDLLLESNDDTLANFPFAFRFEIRYELSGSSLKLTYHVHNTGDSVMYFSVGGHPAFKLPMAAGLAYSNYYLEFNHPEHARRWPITKEGLIEATPVELLNNTNRLPLTKELFKKDALVFKGLSSNSVALKSDGDKHGLLFDFTGFPYLGIWAAKDADFVCIEPWCGIADSIHTDQQLSRKEGIQALQPSKDFERTWSVTLF